MTSVHTTADRRRPHSFHKTPAVLKVCCFLGLFPLIYVCMDVCSAYRVEPERRLIFLIGTLVAYHFLTAFAWRKAGPRGGRQ